MNASAGSSSPVSINQRASDSPTLRGSRTLAPAAGSRPLRACPSPISVPAARHDDIARRAQARARRRLACPCSAATTGFGARSISAKHRETAARNSVGSSPRAASSNRYPRSAPAQKLGPSPAITTTAVFFVAHGLGQCPLEGCDERRRQRVASFGAVEPQPASRAALLDQQRVASTVLACSRRSGTFPVLAPRAPAGASGAAGILDLAARRLR